MHILASQGNFTALEGPLENHISINKYTVARALLPFVCFNGLPARWGDLGCFVFRRGGLANNFDSISSFLFVCLYFRGLN